MRLCRVLVVYRGVLKLGARRLVLQNAFKLFDAVAGYKRLVNAAHAVQRRAPTRRPFVQVVLYVAVVVVWLDRVAATLAPLVLRVAAVTFVLVAVGMAYFAVARLLAVRIRVYVLFGVAAVAAVGLVPP